MDSQPISLHYQKLEEWLVDRRAVLEKKHKQAYAAVLSTAPRLVQAVRYDIPALRKQCRKLESLIEECQRVSSETEGVTYQIHQRRLKFLRDYGILGVTDTACDDFEAQLERRINASALSLTEQLQQFVSDAMEPFFESYGTFVAGHSDGMYAAETVGLKHFPWLSRVLAEAGYPLSLSAASEALKPSGTSAPEVVIDWGEGADTTMEDAAAPAVVIDWGGDAAAGVDVEPVPSACAAAEPDDVPPASEFPTRSIDLARPAHKAELVCELQAMLCFAAERETAGDTALAQVARQTRDVIAKLTTSTEAELLRMKYGFRFKEAFTAEVERFQCGIHAANGRKGTSLARGAQAQAELSELEPQLHELVDRARADQEECLNQLRRMFPGREVLIIGDITNTLE